MAQLLVNPTPPEVLYKYRGEVSRDVKCLLVDRCLYLASPLKLNDPFDCYPTVAVPPPEQREQVIASELAKLPQGYSAAEFERRCRLVFNSESHRLRFAQEFYEEDLGKVGVLSLSAPRDEPLLWAHYARNGTGFSVGYRGRDDGELEALGAAPVTYSMKRPAMTLFRDDEDWFRILHTKSAHWAYEKEWRHVRPAEFGGAGMMTVPRNSIVEVCLGPRITASDRQTVIEAARALPDKPQIVQVELDRESYSLKCRNVDFK